ncbi:MAG: response regulator transcription factor [Gammaproteobacteria bacterium]|nr:response regulator transcription factor [Gammaproteobacteria bacterium]
MDISVLLVEDHALVRAGMKSLLAEADGIQVCGEASDGRQAVEFVGQQTVDVVVMDITMPGLNGLEATARIKKVSPESRILILSMYANEEYVIRALRLGATGYLVKEAAAPELVSAIRMVAAGDRYLSSSLDTTRILDLMGSATRSASAHERLTPRQREILQLVVEGHKTREIAQMLEVSIKTVETHRAQLMDRLGIRDVAGLVKYAIRVGMVSAHS